MIPPSSSDGDFGGNGYGGDNGFGAGSGYGGNGSSAGTQLLTPARTTLPADPVADWGDNSAAWPSEPQQSGINPLEFLRSLQRRWMLALAVAGGLSILVMIAVFLLFPSEQESTAYLRVAPVKPSYADAKKARSASQDEVQRNQQNEMAFCKSENVLRAVVREPKVLETRVMQANKGQPVDFLTEQVQVGFVPRSDIMFVQMKGDKKEELAIIVNEVVRKFLEQGVYEERTKLKKQIVDLREVVRQKQNELTTARDSLSKQADAAGAPSSDNARVQNELLLAELSKMRALQSNAEAEYNAQKRKLQFMHAQLAEIKGRGPTSAMVDQHLAGDPIYVELKTQVASIEQALQGAGGRGSAANRQFAQQYQSLQNRVTEYRRQASKQVQKGLADQLNSEIRLLTADLRIIGAQAVQYKQDSEKAIEEVKKKTAATKDLADKEDNIMRLREYIDSKTSLTGEMDLELMAPDRVEVMQWATSPETISPMQRIMITLGAGFITGCIGICAVGGWEYLKHRLSSVGDVNKHLGLSVVGTVPTLPSRAGAQVARGISAEQFDTLLADSIDSIRASLIHGAASDGHRLLMVTSAWEGEGKTTVASQLAASLARCGRRTLLVDADFRNPALHELFEMENDAGLCEVLRGEIEPQAAVRETPAANLWLLSAGACCHRSIQALDNDSISMLFKELKAEYDFVVVDTAPVLAVADPMLIGQHMDGALVSVRLGHSQRPKVDEAVKRLRRVGIAVFGAVVNGTKPVRSRRAVDRIALPANG